MTVAEATPELDFPEEASRDDRAFLGHPKGLGYLSFVEGCERFSYYAMQTLLVLYMVKYLLLPENVGKVLGLSWLRGWHYAGLDGQPLASAIFGDYTSLVYLTPILGGVIADRWLGRKATLIAGAVIMSLGHFLMAFEGLFLFALISLVVGVGLFKGNIASQVGELYKPNDLRRAMAFQIFYIAINVSVIAAPLISGTLGEEVGWHYGFGSAGVVMVISLLAYLKAQPWLPADNRAPKNSEKSPRAPLTKSDWPRLGALAVLVPVLAIAMMTNQEIFNAYLVWADDRFNLNIPDWLAAIQWHVNFSMFGHLIDWTIKFPDPLPTSWMIAIDATLSFSMLVAVAAFWKWYSARTGREPDELGKMIIGSVFSICGGMCLVLAAATAGGGKIGLFWPVMFHLFNSIGFAHIMPVSLALFTKIAPRSLNATVVGIYYLAFFGANKIVGVVGGWYSTMDTVSFWLTHVGAAAFGLIAFAAFKIALGKTLAGEPGPA
ncbi:peptide MFS transporter [Novosphingobium clariflavum]|uniref:Peptide MFS transporter n=1 Tax=Novosphingobium clariflavum TaxID=2029884 RepID=A0ABV6S365_9SPHN|nr:peptide MFS transporter [Novosphingobium clariflavum]